MVLQLRAPGVDEGEPQTEADTQSARTARLARLVRLVRLIRIVKLYSMMSRGARSRSQLRLK